MIWWIYALAKKVLGVVPFGGRIWDNTLDFVLGSGVDRIEGTLEPQIELITALNKCNKLKNKYVLEIGTGWTAMGAFCLYLCGARRVITVDINRHLNQKNFVEMIGFVKSKINKIAKLTGVPKKSIENKLALLDLNQDLAHLLNSCNILYLCPYTLKDLEKEAFDVVFSVEVLEHLKKEDLVQFAKIKKKHLVQAHQWAMTDHFSYKDESITRFNFLKFSDFFWENIIMNHLAYQNRLREKDIIELFQNEGYTPVYKNSGIHLLALKQLRTIKINKKFSNYSDKELIVTSSRVIFNK